MLMQIAHAPSTPLIRRDASARLACWRASYVRVDELRTRGKGDDAGTIFSRRPA